MTYSMLVYFVPLVPILTNATLFFVFRHEMRENLASEDEQDREAHRSYIAVMTGFTFAALLGLVLLDPANAQGLQLAIFSLLVSFFCYLGALNLQGYKAKRWQDQISNTLIDTASISLILAIIAVLCRDSFPTWIRVFTVTGGSIVWLTDHVIRFTIQWKYIKAKGGVQNE